MDINEMNGDLRVIAPVDFVVPEEDTYIDQEKNEPLPGMLFKAVDLDVMENGIAEYTLGKYWRRGNQIWFMKFVACQKFYLPPTAEDGDKKDDDDIE